jgi:leader peptidase (prepilin peptidase)/N-methyltransferase
VEVVSAVVLLVLGRDAMALWCVGLVGVGLAFVDVRVHRLPNVLTLAFFAGALVFAFDPVRLGPALLGAAVAAGLYLVLAFGAGFGLGDAKLAAGLGLILGWYGWTALLLGLAAGLVLSGLFAAALLAVRRVGRRTQLAHGPFMLLGGLLAVALVAPACPPICLPIRTVLATLPPVPA